MCVAIVLTPVAAALGFKSLITATTVVYTQPFIEPTAKHTLQSSQTFQTRSLGVWYQTVHTGIDRWQYVG
jgi:hypothetical protein